MSDFQWDDHNTDHVARHDVDEVEVEEAATDPQRVSFSAHSGYVGYIGKTEGGRILVVILKCLDRATWRPVTARDASVNEKKSYRRRTR